MERALQLPGRTLGMATAAGMSHVLLDAQALRVAALARRLPAGQ